ncbi:MAG: hypothetical protein IJ122_07560 [Methanobrevibacter sp.]|nr:hypothetical protein [Methanobrevibacter sp.]
MNPDLAEEIDYLIDLLSKFGFFSYDEILEILEDQFIEEELDFSQFDISLNESSNNNFNKLEDVFTSLAKDNIVAIHNCGFDIEEGVADAFELFVHLKNNKFNPDGFCFYTFDDVEECLIENHLKITFGDFENDENKALDIGKVVARSLKDAGFEIEWNETVNNQITINPFEWDKSFSEKTEYEIEGAYENFIKRC